MNNVFWCNVYYSLLFNRDLSALVMRYIIKMNNVFWFNVHYSLLFNKDLSTLKVQLELNLSLFSLINSHNIF